ncbi:HpcH/HpaI aldolase/citrate lyase family protein [Phenylobacterium sp.]|uniref:HpcH/HpaI aldolase family protein n=1 Tax=Phenylobacterium sp. TaxID=1871053 RepID=UPI002F92DA94
MAENSFKAALAGGGRLAGLWCQVPSPTVAEVLAHSGCDWLLLDMEHGQADLSEVRTQLQAANGAPAALLVRTPGHDPVLIKRLLDMGAETLLIPMVESAEQARQLVGATRYPPAGFRGVAGVSRASAYGRDRDYQGAAAQRTCVVVQIESVPAVEAAGEIAAVDGVDALFVGPADLSAGMGLLGQPRHADVEAAVRRVLEAASAAGKPVGTFGLSPEDAGARFAEGFRFVSVATDVRLLVQGAVSFLKIARGD